MPAFGWHPWFSHQIYIETEYDGAESLSAQQKRAHYRSVLAPQPGESSEDEDFLKSLPDPSPLGHFLSQTRDYLNRYPTALIGEVGLDKSFRIPFAWQAGDAARRDTSLTPGGREGRRLSPYRVQLDHQKKILLAQLRLAGEMGRAVSVHGVAAHGHLYETVAETWKGREKQALSHREKRKIKASKRDREVIEAAENNSTTSTRTADDGSDDSEEKPSGPQPFPPRICLHAFSATADTVKPYVAPTVPCDVFFSFNTTVNTWSADGTGKLEAAIAAVPNANILVESDLDTAGTEMDKCLEEVVLRICKIKGWGVGEGVLQLGKNWRRFVFGEE